jgi:hypothetical protein
MAPGKTTPSIATLFKSAPLNHDAIIKQLSLWLADSFRPFSTVDDPLFREFILLLNPKFKLPHKETMRTQTGKISHDLKQQVRVVGVRIVLTRVFRR